MNCGKTFIVVGGGVAGVSCAQELCKICSKDDQVVLFSSQKLFKQAVVVDSISENLEDVQLKMEKGDEIFGGLDSIRYVSCAVQGLDPEEKLLLLDTGETQRYDKVCICTGATPKLILESDCVTTLRDTDSILSLCANLEECESMMVVGNGGIALDVVYVSVICIWVL
jgi:NAD(P)H-nitrite reductase large subunit